MKQFIDTSTQRADPVALAESQAFQRSVIYQHSDSTLNHLLDESVYRCSNEMTHLLIIATLRRQMNRFLSRFGCLPLDHYVDACLGQHVDMAA